MAQLARAVALQAIGQGFESPYLHTVFLTQQVFDREQAHKSGVLKKRRGKGKYGQANTGLRWMPWSYPAKKVVVSCEKLRGGANIQRSAGNRMG
jgi:hypothetical protein